MTSAQPTSWWSPLRALLRCSRSGQRQSVLVLRSDGKCELGEGGRQSVLWIDVGGEFVVATAQVLQERVTSRDHLAERSHFSPRIGRMRAVRRP